MTKQMNFELGSRVKKDVFRFFSHELRQRKPCRFPHEIKPPRSDALPMGHREPNDELGQYRLG